MPNTNGRSLPILCLEDDPHVGHMLTRVLAQHEVDLVGSAELSREKIRQRSYAAWLLDVSVPDGSGLDVLAWARARGDETPALVMTGLDDRSMPNRAQELGAEFLFKPYSKACLDSFLARSEQSRTTRASLSHAVERLARHHDMPRRERDIVEALVRGVARTELGGELRVSENTVKSIVRRLLGRTAHDNLDELLRSLLRVQH